MALCPAQGKQPPGPPAGQEAGQPSGAGPQDPEKATPKPIEETPEQRIQRLEEELRKLQSELAFVRERAASGTMAEMIRRKLAQRTLSLKSIDAGASKAAVPNRSLPPRQPAVKRARIATPDDALAEGVALTVAGQPIRQDEIDKFVDYLGSFSGTGDDSLRKSRAVMELMRTAAARASFGAEAAELEKRLADIRKRYEDGESFEALVKQNSQGPNADKGGDISPVTRNSYHGLAIEHAAFTTPEGKLSPILHTPMGLSMLLVTKVQKGASPEQDQVSARLLSLNYIQDQVKLFQASQAVMTGQLEIVVRDEDAMQLLPPMFRPMQQPAVSPSDIVPGKGEIDADQPPAKPLPDKPVPGETGGGKPGKAPAPERKGGEGKGASDPAGGGNS
ncbi:MAG: hypothetical protein Fur0037_08310 [Planctomycetota bacterium]